MSAQNAYPKAKIIATCKEALISIDLGREQLRKVALSGIKERTFFGRTKTEEERWKEVDYFTKSVIRFSGSHTRQIADKVLSVAEVLEGDVINISNSEMEYLSPYMPENKVGSTVHEVGCNCGFCKIGSTKA